MKNLVSWIIVILIGIMPIFTLTKPNIVSGIYYLLLFFCLVICILINEKNYISFYAFPVYRNLACGLIFYVFVVLSAYLFYGKIHGSDLERSLRMSLGCILVLEASLRINPSILKHISWGFSITALIASTYLVKLVWPDFSLRPNTEEIHNAVTFGDILLIVSMLSVYSIGWNLTRFTHIEKFIKIFAFLFGIFGLIITQTRGAWVAVPFFITITLFFLKAKLNHKKIIILLSSLILLVWGILYTKPAITERFKLIETETEECFANPNADSSICIRFQLWRASMVMFKSNIIIGNGSTGQFASKLQELSHEGFVSKLTGSEFGEPHNEFMQSISSYGLLGLISLLLIYFIPGYLFIKRLIKNKCHSSRLSASMGLIVVVGFVIFGFTELMFRTMHVISLYSVLIAIFIALSDENYLNQSN